MTDTVDSPEEVRAVLAQLDGPNAEFYTGEGKALLARYAALLEQVAAHNQRCAGEFVPVTERLPVGPEPMNYRVVVQTALGAVYADTVEFNSGEWHFTMEQWEPGLVVTHWLDARLPGGEG